MRWPDTLFRLVVVVIGFWSFRGIFHPDEVVIVIGFEVVIVIVVVIGR